MNAIFSSRGFGAKVEGSRKLRVDTAIDEKKACDEMVSDDNRVLGDGVTSDATRSKESKQSQ
jgi:hypothetical protein